MNGDLLATALQMAGCIVVAALAGAGWVRAACWYAGRRGR